MELPSLVPVSVIDLPSAPIRREIWSPWTVPLSLPERRGPLKLPLSCAPVCSIRSVRHEIAFPPTGGNARGARIGAIHRLQCRAGPKETQNGQESHDGPCGGAAGPDPAPVGEGD
jgi:hypothetical protein